MNGAMVRRAIDRGPQRRFIGRTFHIHPEFRRYAVARRGSHQAISGQFAADYRNKAAHSVPCPVIEQRKAAADLAAPGNLDGHRRIQRTNTAEDAQDARVNKPRNQFIAQPQQMINLLAGSGQSFRAGHANRRCAQNAYGAGGHQNVGIAGLAAAIDDAAIQPVIEHQQRSLIAEHGHIDAGHGCNALRPASCGVDHHLAGDFVFLAAARIAIANSAHTPVCGENGSYFTVGQEAPAARNRSFKICEHQPENIDVRIRTRECAKNVRRQVRLQLARFFTAQPMAANANLAGSAPPLFEECRVILGTLDKNSPNLIHAMRRNGLDDAVFRDALARCVRVLDSVAAAGVQQTVATPGSSVGDVSLLQQDGGDAAQTQVPKNAGPCCASAYNHNLRRFHTVPFKLTANTPHRKPRGNAEASWRNKHECPCVVR